MSAIGSVWGPGTWADDVWAPGSWGEAESSVVIPEIVDVVDDYFRQAVTITNESFVELLEAESENLIRNEGFRGVTIADERFEP